MYTAFWWGKSEGKRELIRRHRWEDNIKMNLPEMGLAGGMDLIGQPQDTDRWRAVVNAVTKLRVGEFLVWLRTG